ncbi:MAG: hypothetical protein AAGF02_02355 [Actinomycetota bacterium]
MSEAATMAWQPAGANLVVDGSSALVATDWTSPRPPVRLLPDRDTTPPIVEPEVARRAAAVALVVGAVFAVVSFFSGLVWSPPAEVPDGAVVVVVEAGDTLWSVARQAVPSGEIAPIVAALEAERGGAPLQVGEAVVVDPG